MKKQVLFAVDGSSRCMQAAAGLAQLVCDQQDYQFLLYHCAPQQTDLRPGEIWDAESSMTFAKKSQDERAERFFAATVSVLKENGISADRIDMAIQYDSTDPGSDILDVAKQRGIETIAIGRRGRSQAQSLMLGSVSSRVAQYAENRTVWVVDAPMNRTRKVLIAVEGTSECRTLTYYAAEWMAAIPNLNYTILHVLPPVPPTLWDDGHILGPDERLHREQDKQNWRSERNRKVEKFMDEAKHALIHGGVPEDRVQTRIENVRQGVARDLLNELDRGQYQLLLIGKRSFQQKKPFLMGSHANKILFNAKAATLCLVDAA
jgi:nucleotide-binding universal stress UspA family protein